jgi:hypothetical protein
MAKISAIKGRNNTVIRTKTMPRSITPTQDADLRDELADEIRNRGILQVDTTTQLMDQEGSDTYKVLVKDIGVFVWKSSGVADNINSFIAAGGGIWENVFPSGKKETFVETLQTVAALKAKKGKPFNIVRTLGYHTAYDGGGNLYYWDESSTATDDGGSVIQVTGEATGRYIAMFNATEVSIKQFGAKGDGVNDDIDAIDKATSYCSIGRSYTLFFPRGTYRITRQWLIGFRILSEAELAIGYWWSSPNWTLVGENTNRRPFNIVGEMNTRIFGDFDAAELRAVIYINIRRNPANLSPNRDQMGVSMKNFIICGKNTVNSSGVLTSLQDRQSSLNQLGILAVNGIGMKFENIMFQNMQRGFLQNACYNTKIDNMAGQKLQYFYHEFGSNTGERSNMHVFNTAEDEIAYNVNSTMVIFNGMWGEGPGTILKCTGQGIVINGLYTEAHQRNISTTAFCLDFEGCDYVCLNGSFVATSYPDNSYAPAVRLGNTAKSVTFNSSRILGNITTSTAGVNKLVFNNAIWAAGTLTGPVKPYYLNDAPILKSLTVDSLITAIDHLEINAITGKQLRLRHNNVNKAIVNEYGVSIAGSTAITDANTVFQVIGGQRYAGTRIFGAAIEHVSDWFNINLTGTQDTFYINIGNYTGFSSNRLSFEIELEGGYVTSNPISLGKLVKRFIPLVTSGGAAVSSSINSIVCDEGLMSSVFAIGNLEAAGSGILRVPIKVLTGITGTEKRASVRVRQFTWSSVNSQFVSFSSGGAATTGIFGTKEFMKLPARIEAPAGTAAAGGAPIKFNLTGALLTTPEAGAIEADNNNIYFTNNAGTRLKLNSQVSQQIIASYTADDESAAYSGIDNAQTGAVYAALADVNNLRTAYENLRSSYENLRNKLIDSGLISFT